MNTCHNNPKNSHTTKINKYIPSRYSLFTHCSFDTTKIESENGKEIENGKLITYKSLLIVLDLCQVH